MKEEINTKKELMKKEIMEVGKLHSAQSKSKQVHGERIRFQAEDKTDLEAVIYRYDKDAPTIYTAFGGGFVMGGCALDDHMWSVMSKRAGANIISVGYRKTPEYKFPTAQTDIYRAICHFTEHAEQYQLNPDKTGIMGASAGGNLAASVTLLDRKYKTDYIRLLILNYPYLDLDTAPENKGHEGDDAELFKLFPLLYLSEDDNRRNPFISPVYAEPEQLKRFPDTYITLAKKDPLCEEGMVFGDRIRQAGGNSKVLVAEDMPHGFLETWFNITDPEQDPKNIYMHDDLKCLFENGKLKAEAEKAEMFIENAIKRVFN